MVPLPTDGPAWAVRLVRTFDNDGMEQTYDISKSYQKTYDQGPLFVSPALPPQNTGPWKTFLGLPVRSRLGIAAGLLLNSR